MTRFATGIVVTMIAVSANDESTSGATTLRPADIFARARDAYSVEHCTARHRFVITVSATADGRLEQRHFQAVWLPDDRYVDVNEFSDEELRAPYVPHGTTIAIAPIVSLPGLSRALTQKLNGDTDVASLLGPPMLDPGYSFGIRRSSNAEKPATDVAAGDPMLRTIVVTRANRRDYEIALVPSDADATDRTFHLRLTPIREPKRFRLRDIYVDATTYAVVRVITDGNFASGPPERTPWETTFHDVDGCHVIARERALGTLDYGSGCSYENATIAFDVRARDDSDRTPIVMFRRPMQDGDLAEPDDATSDNR